MLPATAVASAWERRQQRPPRQCSAAEKAAAAAPGAVRRAAPPGTAMPRLRSGSSRCLMATSRLRSHWLDTQGTLPRRCIYLVQKGRWATPIFAPKELHKAL